MTIKTLTNTPIEEIVDCLLDAFSDYFVKMPPDVQYWKNRFQGARVDYASSVGMYDKHFMAGFIVHGIDVHKGELTALNSGTGVRQQYRSQKAVDRMYDFILPLFRKKEIRKCLLEVIQENHKAIRVYERIGFEIIRQLKCFQGEIDAGKKDVLLERIDFADLSPKQQPNLSYNSWDNTNEAITASQNIYRTYLVRTMPGGEAGYFTINESTGYVAQIESPKGAYDLVLTGISKLSREVRINNIDTRRADLIQTLISSGLENNVNQYEMEMRL